MHALFSFLGTDPASNLAPHVDWIFWSLTALCGSVTLLVMTLIIVFSVLYRRNSPASRGGKTQSLAFEIGWTLVPFFIFLGIFAWAADVFVYMSKPPADATEIYVVGKQWMWKVQHQDGRREINELHIPIGRPVKLVMTSQDVIHDFFVPAFRNKQDVVPGRYTTEWFTPTKLGKYHIFCSQYCGTDHSRMVGWVYVMEPQEHERWLEQAPAPISLAAKGERLFHTFGCSGCHAANSQIHAPLLEGVYGKPVPLSDRSVVIADDQYIRDSILLPSKQIAAGYPDIMPSFQGRISEEELFAIITYLKSLGTAERNTP